MAKATGAKSTKDTSKDFFKGGFPKYSGNLKGSAGKIGVKKGSKKK